MGCARTSEAKPLRALLNDPAIRVQPRGASPSGSKDSVECHDRFDGEQPELFRSYIVSGRSPQAGMQEMSDELQSMGWSRSDPPYVSLTKSIDGQTVVLSLAVVNEAVTMTATVPNVDYC